MGYRKRTNAKGEPRWEVYWTFTTVHRNRKTLSCTVIAPHNAAGERQARQAEAGLIEKAKARHLDRPDENMTVEQLVERWIQQHEDDWSPGQGNEQRARAENHVYPPLGKKRITDVTGRDLDQLYTDLTRAGLAPATVATVHRLINASFHQALRWQLIPTNPGQAATPPRLVRPQHKVPSIEELRAALHHLEEDPKLTMWSTVVRVAAATGCRRGMLGGLQWHDITIDRGDDGQPVGGEINFRRATKDARGVGVVVKPSKTGRSWKVAIDASTATRLAAWRGHADHVAALCRRPVRDTDFVFSGRSGPDRPLSPASITRWWGRHRRRLGLPGVRFHDLRHAHATHLISEGMDITTVSHRLGHATPNVTLGIYSHAVPSRDQAAAGLVGIGLG